MEEHKASICKVIVSVLAEMTEDWGLELSQPIESHTAVVNDLDFSSVDIIQLVVAIEEQFGGARMGFQEILMVDGLYVEDITVKDLATFVAGKVTQGACL